MIKKKAKKYKEAASNIILTLILAIITFSIYKYSYKVNYYNINNIIISGNNFLDKSIINRIISDKVENKSIFSIDLNEIRMDINNNSFINSSNIYKVLPQSLFISVQEINPIALYEKNDQIYFIDYNNNLIEADIESINFFDVPIISQNNIRNYEYKESGKLIREIYDQSKLLFNDVNEVEHSNEYINIKLRDKTKIILDRKSPMKKLEILFEFLKKIDYNISIYKYINLTIPNQIIVKEKYKTI